MVPPMRHYGPLSGSEHKAPLHNPVLKGGGVEEKVASVGGTVRELREVLSDLWLSVR